MSDTRPYPDGTLTILAGNRSWGRCGYCGRRVCWVVSSPRGSKVPFDAEPFVIGTRRNEQTQLRFEIVSRDTIHFQSCSVRRGRPRVPSADARCADRHRGPR